MRGSTATAPDTPPGRRLAGVATRPSLLWIMNLSFPGSALFLRRQALSAVTYGMSFAILNGFRPQIGLLWPAWPILVAQVHYYHCQHRDRALALRSSVRRTVWLVAIALAGAYSATHGPSWTADQVFKLPALVFFLVNASLLGPAFALLRLSRLRAQASQRPDATVDAIAPPKADEHVGGRIDNGLVLVADPDPAVRKILEFHFRASGYRAITASDGSCALALAQQASPDVIVVETQLPDMSGADLIQRLRALPDTARIPVVILTKNSDIGLMLHYLDSGVLDYITKPFGVNDVIRRTHDVVGCSRTGVQRNG